MQAETSPALKNLTTKALSRHSGISYTILYRYKKGSSSIQNQLLQVSDGGEKGKSNVQRMKQTIMYEGNELITSLMA